MDYTTGNTALNAYPPGVLGGASKAISQAQVQSADTLVRALSSLDELNKRLHSFTSETYQIAEAVGGPYPVDEASSVGDPNMPSAMGRLNRGLDEAHRTLNSLEQAMGAIRRSLGA